MGLSGAPDDTLLGWAGSGVASWGDFEDSHEYGDSFWASKLPQGVGSAASFIIGGLGMSKGVGLLGKGLQASARGTGRIAAATSRVGAHLAGRSARIPGLSGAEGASVEAQILARTTAHAEGVALRGTSATVAELEAAGRASVALLAGRIKDAGVAAAERYATKAAMYKGMGSSSFLGAQVQGAEGYHDYLNVLLKKAREQGREELYPSEIRQARMAYYWNIPGGLVEGLGMEAFVIARALKGSTRAWTRGEIGAHGKAKLDAQHKAASAWMKLEDNLNATTKGLFAQGMVNPAIATGRVLATGTATEYAQESAQTMWSNLVANNIIGYDENRSLFKDVADSGEVGGAVGFLMAAMLHTFGRKGRRLGEIHSLRDQAKRQKELGNNNAYKRINAEAVHKLQAYKESYNENPSLSSAQEELEAQINQQWANESD